MDRTNIMICLAIVFFVALGLYLFGKSDTEKYNGYGYVTEPLPTSPEVEYIEGGPDIHVVDSRGVEIIPAGDIALSPGFGVGQGTFGFGRYGSSFIV